MEFINNTLCISRQLLIDKGIVSIHKWDNWVKYGAKLVKRGFADFYSIPKDDQDMLKLHFGVPEEQAANVKFKDLISVDPAAVNFYNTHVLADGRILGTISNGKYSKQYSTNASVLNAIDRIFTDQQAARAAFGSNMRGFWNKASRIVNNLRVELDHTLPKNFERLRDAYNDYKKESYVSLISKKFGNDNTVKVTDSLERLLMSLYTRQNKPFVSDVYTDYLLFMAGKIELVDTNTGEQILPQSFYNKRGEAVIISEKTVWNYMNLPHNRVIVDSMRNGQFEYNGMHRPHHHRKAPVFSFSKISMDDRDLPRKLTGGDRVKAYYAYDVTSGCVIGKSYSLRKDEELFIDCMQDMLRTIEKHNLGMPIEVEVEHHLVSRFRAELDMMFSFVRWCNPGNSQEKHAEHFNRAKKYGTEKKNQNGIGRWWSKHEAYRVDNMKVDNEFVEKVFTFESLVADDDAAVRTYNNSLHPKQNKYPGKTRWQVLVENMNPQASQPAKPIVYKAIGNRTATSINRNQYVQVQYGKYVLPSPAELDKLQPGNYEVQAYYLPNADGQINEVYLWQGDKYICAASLITQYNTAKAEWVNGEDDAAYKEQAAYVSQFDAKVKRGKKALTKIEKLEAEMVREVLAESKDTIVETQPTETIEDILNDFNPDDYINQSNQNI